MSDESSAMVTKIRSKFGKFLTSAEYRSLTQKNDINDVINVIKSLPHYAEAFKGTSGMALHRGTAEDVFEKHFFEIYEELLKFSFIGKEGFLSYYVKREEIRQIINAAMYINAGVSDMIAYKFPNFLAESTHFDLYALMASTNYFQFVSALSGTEYYDVLRGLTEDYKKFPDIIVLENALMNNYYSDLFEDIHNSYADDEQKELEKCLKHSIDMYNLRICYRLRGLLGLSPEEAEKSIIPIYGFLKKDIISEILLKNTEEEILSYIVRLPWLKVNNDNTDMGFEKILGLSDYEFYRTKLFLSESDSVVLYSFMELLKYEKSNLITVIEGIRYSLEPSQIENMLIVYE